MYILSWQIKQCLIVSLCTCIVYYISPLNSKFDWKQPFKSKIGVYREYNMLYVYVYYEHLIIWMYGVEWKCGSPLYYKDYSNSQNSYNH